MHLIYSFSKILDLTMSFTETVAKTFGVKLFSLNNEVSYSSTPAALFHITFFVCSCNQLTTLYSSNQLLVT